MNLSSEHCSGEKYAVKVLDRRRMDLGVYEKQVRIESKILQSLDHPNIVQIKRILKSRVRNQTSTPVLSRQYLVCTLTSVSMALWTPVE